MAGQCIGMLMNVDGYNFPSEIRYVLSCREVNAAAAESNF
jgi:hypothetical protein